MGANIQAIVQGILTATDNTQSPAPFLVNIDLLNPTLTGTKFYYDAFFQVQTSPGSVIPIGGGGGAEAFLILVINRSLTNTLQINVVGTGGPTAEVGVFGPGGVCLLVDPTETGSGWSSLTLIAVGGVVPATIFTAI